MTPRKSEPKNKAAKSVKATTPAAPRTPSPRSAGSAAAKPRAGAAKPPKPPVPKAASKRVPPRVEEPVPVALGPRGIPLAPEERARFEGILLAERGRLLKEMGHLEDTVLNRSLRDSSGELSGYSFHMADIGTDAMEREKAFLFASAEGRALLDVNEALRRLYNGEYGICEVCGQAISTPRLEVVPQARLCLRCKEKEEREPGGRAR